MADLHHKDKDKTPVEDADSQLVHEQQLAAFAEGRRLRKTGWGSWLGRMLPLPTNVAKEFQVPDEQGALSNGGQIDEAMAPEATSQSIGSSSPGQEIESMIGTLFETIRTQYSQYQGEERGFLGALCMIFHENRLMPNRFPENTLDKFVFGMPLYEEEFTNAQLWNRDMPTDDVEEWIDQLPTVCQANIVTFAVIDSVLATPEGVLALEDFELQLSEGASI